MKDRKLFLPSIADVFFISIFLYLSFSAGQGLLSDADTGYHIRAGEYIIETRSVPMHDIFSFLSPPISWTAHEWLSEVIMAAIHSVSGLTGLVIFFSFLIAFIYYLFFRIVRSYGFNIIVASLIVSMVIATSQIHWLARPHIFSLLFMIIWYYVLELYQNKDKNYLYILPLTMLIWVNLHGGFMGGFILIGTYIAGNILMFIFFDRAERQKRKTVIKSLCLTTLASVLVALINPYGFNILLFPFKLTSNKFIMDNVNEFISPNFHEPMFFTYMLFLIIGVLAVSRRAINIIELMLLLLFTYMALYSARYIPLFAIISAPILLRQCEGLLNGSSGRLIEILKRRGDRISATDGSAKGYLLPAISVAVIIIIALSGGIRFEFDRKIKPVDAVEFIKKEKIGGNMFNNDEFGDYIIYAAWPEYRVFFDGRSDMYGTERMKEYFKIARLERGWDKVIEKYNIKWVIFNTKSALAMFLTEREDWHLIYADKVAAIFVKDIPENRHLIEKYRDVRLVGDEDKERI